jgi:hypothetical protein
MSNTVITPTIFAKEATMILNNNLTMAKQVYRGLESDFGNSINGYQPGDTVSMRIPTDFTVRTGANASSQDVTEGKVSLTVGTQAGVDFSFTSKELTLNIKELSERVIKPAMIQLANKVDSDIMSLYKDVPNLVGTAGQTVNSFADFALAPQRLDELAVPADRAAALSPADSWGLVGSQTALYMSDVAKDAYRNGNLGPIAGVDTFASQNVQTHTVGVATGTPLVNGASQTSTYATVAQAGMTQTLNTDGWTNSTTGILKKGDVITIAGVYAVNPVTKATLPFLKQFVVTADCDSGASTGPAALTIYPAIIASGAFQNVSAAPADNAAITVVTGTGGTGYRQNMVFNKNAFALAMVPLVSPPGAVDVARQSFEGTSVRVIPYYTGSSDVSAWRLDILYGVKTLDPRLATRLYGS